MKSIARSLVVQTGELMVGGLAVSPRGMSSPGGETTFSPYVTVRFWLTESGGGGNTPAGSCAKVVAANALNEKMVEKRMMALSEDGTKRSYVVVKQFY